MTAVSLSWELCGVCCRRPAIAETDWSRLRPGVTDDVPLAGDVLDHALALQDLQGPCRDAVRDLVMLGDRMHRWDAAGHGPLGDLVSQHLGYLLIRRHRRVRVDHRGQHAPCAGSLARSAG